MRFTASIQTRLRTPVLLLVLTPLFLQPGALAGQETPVPTLEPAKRFSSEGFSRVRGVQELPDGRVLVADQREEALYRVDFERQERALLGSRGEGPGEYRGPTGLYPFRGDSVVMVDLQNGRLAVVSPEGAVARTELIFGEGLSIPEGVDVRGNRYWDRVTRVRMDKRSTPSADQAPIERYNLTTAEIDTVGFLTIPGPANPNAFPAWDDWAVGPKGRVAIVRNQGEYRLDWIEEDGTFIRGAPVEGYQPLRVSGADERAVQEGDGGVQGGSARMGSQPTPRPPERAVPDRFPPAKLGRIWVTWDGRAVVERHQHLDQEKPLFDVFDADGHHAGSFHLPPSREIVGVGPSGIYAVQRDELDFLWLELYRLPGHGSLKPGPKRAQPERDLTGV